MPPLRGECCQVHEESSGPGTWRDKAWEGNTTVWLQFDIFFYRIVYHCAVSIRAQWVRDQDTECEPNSGRIEVSRALAQTSVSVYTRAQRVGLVSTQMDLGHKSGGTSGNWRGHYERVASR